MELLQRYLELRRITMPKTPEFNVSQDGELRCTMTASIRLTHEEYGKLLRIAEQYSLPEKQCTPKMALELLLRDGFYTAILRRDEHGQW